MSSLVFGRCDMGVVLSMFACLWRGVARAWPGAKTQAVLLKEFETEDFRSAAVSLMRDMGSRSVPLFNGIVVVVLAKPRRVAGPY